MEVFNCKCRFVITFYSIYIACLFICIHRIYDKERWLKQTGWNIRQSFSQGYSHLTVALLVSFDVNVPPYFFKSQSTPIKSNFSCTLSKNNTIQCMKNYHSKYPFRSYCSDVTDDRLCKQRVQLYFFLQRRFSPIND